MGLFDWLRSAPKTPLPPETRDVRRARVTVHYRKNGTAYRDGDQIAVHALSFDGSWWTTDVLGEPYTSVTDAEDKVNEWLASWGPRGVLPVGGGKLVPREHVVEIDVVYEPHCVPALEVT